MGWTAPPVNRLFICPFPFRPALAASPARLRIYLKNFKKFVIILIEIKGKTLTKLQQKRRYYYAYYCAKLEDGNHSQTEAGQGLSANQKQSLDGS